MNLLLEQNNNPDFSIDKAKNKPSRLDAGKGGYGGYTAFSYISITLFNIFVGGLLFIIALPIMLFLAIFVYLVMGWPILYKGVRLGRNRKPFTMYKFRTLPKGAQQILGEALLSPKDGMVTPFTRLLRDTRLDELPQLWNIIACDMDFVGPRPLRPEVYESCCRIIPGFDVRFEVRPGLVGYSQLFTPHSTPKRIRSLIDSRSLRRQRKLKFDILLLLYTVFLFASSVLYRGTNFIWKNLFLGIAFKRRELRSMDRIDHEHRKTFFTYGLNGSGIKNHVLDMNDGYLRVQSNCRFDKEFDFRLECEYTINGKQKRKTAKCKGAVYKELKIDGEHTYTYIVYYEPASPLNSYLIDQYFLHKSFAMV